MPTSYTDLSSIKEHPVYQLGDKVAEICSPLFNNFPINYFLYCQLYCENDKIIVIDVVADKNWVLHYVPSNYPFLITGKKIYSWSTVMPPKAQKEAATNFKHHNGIILENIRPDYIEAIEFASPDQYSSPLEFCSNKNLLNKFILYFKEKAANIIKTLIQEPLCLPKNRFLNLKVNNNPYIEFCQAIKTKRLSLKFNSQNVILSHREFDILSLLIKGKTMREIAQILKISPRTVETYIYTAKCKTNTFTTSRLLDLFADSLF